MRGQNRRFPYLQRRRVLTREDAFQFQGRPLGRSPPPARGVRPSGPAPPRLQGARQGDRVSRTFFEVRCTRAPFFALFGRCLLAFNCDLAAQRCSDLRFCRAPSTADSLRAPPGRLPLQRTSKNVRELRSRRRACNEPQKMCGRTVADARSPGAHAVSGHVRPEASRTKPALIAAGRGAAASSMPAADSKEPQLAHLAICGGFVRRTCRS